MTCLVGFLFFVELDIMELDWDYLVGRTSPASGHGRLPRAGFSFSWDVVRWVYGSIHTI